MTKTQLNTKAHRLYKTYQKNLFELAPDDFFSWVENSLKRQFMEIHNAESSAENLSKVNMLRMIALNRKQNIIPLHRFFIFMNENIL